MLRIGEKKVKNGKNGTPYIHSIQTANSYRRTANQLAENLKRQGIRNIKDIQQQHIQAFFDERKSYSPYTLSRELSAVNKMLSTSYTKNDFSIPSRNSKAITNNRGLAKNDRSHIPRQQEALNFVRCTGIRRQSISNVTPSQAIRDKSGLVIGFHVKEKGGRERCCTVLRDYRQDITALVDVKIKANGADKPMFSQVDKNANPHYCRREYAQQLYQDLSSFRGDYYNGMRERFINEEQLNRACIRYKGDTVKGYDKQAIAEISQNLGHNRLSVVLVHYMK